jgi:branched-chain amino acid transport system permease protein
VATDAPSAPSELRERLASLATLLGLVCLVTALGSLGSPVLQNVLVNGLIELTLVVGLYIFVGNTGVFSFGHIGFMAIGAYTAALLRVPEESKSALLQLPGFLERAHTSSLVATLVGGAVATLVAAVVALPITRLGGLTAGLGTFAVLNIIYVVASNWDEFTGGSTGMAAVPTTTDIPTALIWALVAICVAWLFQQTRLCLRVRASREDEYAARAIGIAIVPERAAALIVSAALCGIAGGIYGQLAGSFGPDAFFLTTTFTIVAMLVVGGRYSLSGAVVGAIFIATITEGLRRIELGVDAGFIHIPSRPGLQEVGLAVALLLTLLLRPRGLTGGAEVTVFGLRGLWARLVRRHRPVNAEPTVEGEAAS